MHCTCNICGAEVSRRQSFSYKDGRACRTHEEVSQEQQRKVDAEKARLENEHKKMTERFHHETRKSFGPTCWLCQKEGIPLRDFYLRQLVGMAKVEVKKSITGEEMNFFQMMDKTLEASGMKGQRILFNLPLEPKQYEFLLRNANYEAKQLIQMTASVVVCPECMKIAKLKYTIPEVNIQQLMQISAMYEVVAKPIVTEIAKAEVAAEAKVN